MVQILNPGSNKAASERVRRKSEARRLDILRAAARVFRRSGVAAAGMPVCTDPSTAGFYCPASTKNVSATIQGRNGSSASVDFSVANAAALVAGNPGFAAFANLAAPQLSADSFDWGLPFFYGRNVHTAIDGMSTPAGPGPYVAF
ncbi:MAG: DUF3443 family protein [Pseudomonadota bacterium]